MLTCNHSSPIISLKTPLFASERRLVLHTSEHIITLLEQGTILAQHRCSRYQFRLLLLLLKLPGGALHAELLAMLDCSEKTLKAILCASSEKDVIRLIQHSSRRWQTHLSQIAKGGQQARRRELAVVRRSLTGKRGLNMLLRDFGVAVYPVYKQGYVLRMSQQESKQEFWQKV